MRCEVCEIAFLDLWEPNEACLHPARPLTPGGDALITIAR